MEPQAMYSAKLEDLYDVSEMVCFSGPRPSGLPMRGDPMASASMKISDHLVWTINKAYQRGKFVFLNGGMPGFDVIGAEAVLKVKRTYPDIQCVTILPFYRDFFENPRWDPRWRKRALKVCQASDEVFMLHKAYRKGVYYEYDRFIVDHSSMIICYHAHMGGNTGYTVGYAKKKYVPVQNLYYLKCGRTEKSPH